MKPEKNYNEKLEDKVCKLFNKNTLTVPEIIHILENAEKRLLEKTKFKKQWKLSWKIIQVKA